VGDIPDWLWQNIVADLINEGLLRTTEGLLFLSWLACKKREYIAEKLKLTPKPVVVPLQGQVLVSSAAQATISVGSSLTALWHVEAPTPPLSTRLFDEAMEIVSVLPRHL
jgi:hypothetical protein